MRAALESAVGRLHVLAKGYDHLRVQDVAERAHVGLATIYRRWETKQDLVIAAMCREKEQAEYPETDPGWRRRLVHGGRR